MKKHLYFVLAFLTIIGVSLFFACDSEEVLKEQEQIETYDNPMKFVGELHNKGLAQIMEEVRSMPITRVHEFDLLSSVDRFISEEFNDLSEEYLEKIRGTLPGIVDEVRLVTRSNADEKTLAKASKNQKQYIEELFVIMSDEDMKLESLHKRIVQLEKKASKDKKLSEAELNQFLAGSTVAYYTLEYWSDYAEEQMQTRAPFSWKGLGKADVIGAVEGAMTVGGAYLLGVGPIGWKVLGAGAAIGAVVGSAGNAIDQLW